MVDISVAIFDYQWVYQMTGCLSELEHLRKKQSFPANAPLNLDSWQGDFSSHSNGF